MDSACCPGLVCKLSRCLAPSGRPCTAKADCQIYPNFISECDRGLCVVTRDGGLSESGVMVFSGGASFIVRSTGTICYSTDTSCP